METVNMRNKNTCVLLMVLSLFLSLAETCLASGGNQPLAQVINKATWIVKAKVVEVKPGSDNWGHLQFKVEKVEVIKGDSKDASLLLNFQAQATANEVDDGNGGKIRKWYMRPQSGQELNIKKDETWFFFSSSSEKDKNGLIQIFRAEPVEQERIIKDLLKNKDK